MHVLLQSMPPTLQHATTDPHFSWKLPDTLRQVSCWVTVPGSWCTQGLFEPSERLWREWGLILNMNLPLLPSCWGFSFAFGCGLSLFFGGIQHSPVDGCSAASCNFGVLTGEDESASFYSVILIPTEAVIKIAGRNVNKLRYADDTTLMAESKEELKSLFMKVKEESEKVGLKINIQKMKIMASGPIISWQIDEKTMETVTDFIFLGSKITADGDCSHEIKRCLLFERKAMTNLDSILKSRDVTLPTKIHLVKAMVFPVVLYGYESWTIRKVGEDS